MGEEYGTSYIPAKNKNFSVVNKLFCVLEEKSTLARMVLLPECGTKLTPGQSIGHAVLVNKQNFGEALVAAFLMDIEVNVILAHNREERRKEAREQDNVLARAREVHDRRGERNTDNRGANLAHIYPTYGLFCFWFWHFFRNFSSFLFLTVFFYYCKDKLYRETSQKKVQIQGNKR